MILYKSILNNVMVDTIIEKSKFVAYAKPVNTREEAIDFINECKSINKTASHNVPAFVIGEKQELQWCSDDGEPQGTAGQPILKLITSEGLTNLVVVVTRYFGGTKLGTGGLVRAYSGIAKDAIMKGQICNVSKGKIIEIKSDYKDFQKILQNSEKGKFTVEKQVFGEDIEANLLTDWENSDKLIQELTDLTNGRFSIVSETERLIKISIDNKNTVC
jgi:uncharacterized YigZ family protein